MATSGTFTFRLTVEEMIREAYGRCGIPASELTGYHAEEARVSLNLLFVDWSVRGVNYWTVDEQTQTLTESTASYTLAAGTIDILTAVIRRDGTDTEMQRISLTDYNALPDKDSEGFPTQYWLDRQYTPTVYLWQVPENSTDQFRYWRVVQLEDVTASSQDADVPYRWTEALCAGLAAKLAEKFATDRQDKLELRAEMKFTHASDDERERATLRIIPPSVI